MARKKAVLLIGDAGTCPDLEYICAFRAVDPVVLLMKGREKSLVVPELELGRARRAAKHTDVWTPGTLGLKGRRARNVSAWAVELLKRKGMRTVTVGKMFPYSTARELGRNGVHVRIAEGQLIPGRAVKNADECRKLRESQQAAVIAMRAAVSVIAEAEIARNGELQHNGKPLTSERVRKVIHHILLDQNCAARHTIVAAGTQSADPHETGWGQLCAHEPIVIDIFPRHLEHGYWGDLTRTVVKGHARTNVRKMYAGVKAAQAAGLNCLKTGVKCSTVHRHVTEEFERRGFETQVASGMGFIHSTGHGVGLAVHEEPSVGNNPQRLRTGHVLTIEPGLYYAGIGGVRIEDTVLITKHGWRYLVPCEKRLEL